MGEFKLKLRNKFFRRTASNPHSQPDLTSPEEQRPESRDDQQLQRDSDEPGEEPSPQPKQSETPGPENPDSNHNSVTQPEQSEPLDSHAAAVAPPSPSTTFRSKASGSQTSLLQRVTHPFGSKKALSTRARTSAEEVVEVAKNEHKQHARPITSGGESTPSKGQQPTTTTATTVASKVVPDENPAISIERPTPDSIVEPANPLERHTALDAVEEQPSSADLTPATTAYTEKPSPQMAPATRKVWVKRNSGAATLVVVKEDDMVDEAKDTILRKYGNSLGRNFDAPDITLRITPRGQHEERILSPDENLCRELDRAFPGGQTLEEALLIHVPTRRTPKQSPGAAYLHQQQAYQTYYQGEDGNRPHESGTEYFPLVPPQQIPSPGGGTARHDHQPPPHERSIAILNTGQLPPLASPGGTRRSHLSRQIRPGYGRQHTASPTALSSSVSSRPSRPRGDSNASTEKHSTAAAPLLPTPEGDNIAKPSPAVTTTPRVSSPRPGGKPRKFRQQKQAPKEDPVLPPTIIDTSVPPINVLIVEDNMINMKLLEQFVRRLKVHWATAVNGREAVQKWRLGGFHLVLMDIQLPIMSGLEATREIRRLERVNHIGVLSSSASSAPNGTTAEEEAEVKEDDNLGDAGQLFKSPVIIVALTASNLQSDRHEALAAGCNDFLTKPVNFTWFERKVKEWGCMQALIDFDGWRKWKDAAVRNGLKDASNPKPGGKKAAAFKPPLLEKSSSTDQSSGMGESPDTIIAS